MLKDVAMIHEGALATRRAIERHEERLMRFSADTGRRTEKVRAMSQTRTRFLFGLATIMSGIILAGGVADRVIVGGPAWRRLGGEAWAAYSRLADLGAGLVAYPIEGIGATVLLVATAVSYFLDGGRRREVIVPLYCAVAFSAGGLLLTLKAAPIMLGLAHAESTSSIQEAFHNFFLWGLYVRGAADMLAFVAVVWALANFGRRTASAEDAGLIT
jgi:hypothetical protein